MMKAVLCMALLSFSFTASATEPHDTLRKCMNFATSLYDKGVYNSIDADYYHLEKLTEVPAVKKQTTRLAINKLLAECVFYRKGPYGPYLGYLQQAFMVLKTTNFLLKFKDLEYYRINKERFPGGNIETAPCAMGIAKGQELLVMQGGIID